MKIILSLLLVCIATFPAFSQNKSEKKVLPDSSKKIMLAEVACGECQLGLEGKGCHLAIRIDGKSYFADGSTIDSHGDAHAKEGFCNAISKAEVQGEIVSDRFKISYIKVLKD